MLTGAALRIPEFVKAARTIRKHKDGIIAAVDRGMSNGRHEGLNNKIRTIVNTLQFRTGGAWRWW